MPGRVFLRGEIYWIGFSHNGKEYRHSAKTEKKREAEKVLSHYLGQCARGEFKGFQEETALYTIGEMLGDLVNDCELRQLRDMDTLKRRIKPLQREFGSVVTSELTERQIDMYVKKRFANGRAAATLQCEMRYLMQAFRIAKRKHLILDIPHMPSMKVNNARQGFFERDDFERMVSLLPAYLQDFTRFAYYSAWRRNEIATLEWRDVQERVIRLRPEVSKNAEGRVLILTGVIAEIIERRRGERKDLLPYVFHLNGRPVYRFEKAWRLACRKAGVPGKKFHDLRRTAVRNMVRAGIPERTAMSISGHKTRAIFDRYNIVNEEDIRKAQGQMYAYLDHQRMVTPLFSDNLGQNTDR